MELNDKKPTDDFNRDGTPKKLKDKLIDWELDAKKLPAIELFNLGTMEMYHGGIYPKPDTFCGFCWSLIKNETPGERIIDWFKFEEDIEDILNALNYYGADKKHPDYLFLSQKLTAIKCKKIAILDENKEYSENEIICLAFQPNGNRLDIPKDIYIHNYNDIKQIMKNFDGKYSKAGFEFSYPAIQVLDRIRNKETLNLKKSFQFYGTPEKLCNILCEKAFDPYSNKSINILEPSAGQGAIIDSVLNWFNTESVHLELKEITAIEYMNENYQVLENKYSSNGKIKLINMDFLEYDEYINFFDVVIANPPFSKAQDIKHFYKMYEVCKPNGLIVSIMSNSFLYNSQKIFKEFRDFLGLPNDAQTRAAGKGGCVALGMSKDGLEQEVFIQTFEAGEFKESGTNVHSALIVLKKNTVSGFNNTKTISFKEELKQLSFFD